MKFTWSNNTSATPGAKESWHAPLNKVTSLSKIVAAVVVISYRSLDSSLVCSLLVVIKARCYSRLLGLTNPKN